MFDIKKFEDCPVIGICRNMDLASLQWLVPIYIDAGFTTLEITMNTEKAERIIDALLSDFPQLNIGAGTVCNMKQLHSALEAGAEFIVTPILDVEVIKECVENKIPIFSGAYSPTEIYQAWSLGVSAVKLFPATQLGPTFIKDILSPLGEVKLLPTGGVNAENIYQFFKVGSYGVGMGSSLFPKEMIMQRNGKLLSDHFRRILSNISNMK